MLHVDCVFDRAIDTQYLEAIRLRFKVPSMEFKETQFVQSFEVVPGINPADSARPFLFLLGPFRLSLATIEPYHSLHPIASSRPLQLSIRAVGRVLPKTSGCLQLHFLAKSVITVKLTREICRD